MFIGTHTLLPVVTALCIDGARLASGRGEGFPAWSIATIGFFGALPDLCTPHLSLEARYSSWSHTLAFTIALLPMAALVSTLFPKGNRLRVALACWLGGVLHLACDALSGGIAWLQPWSDSILGTYYIHPNYWPVSDAVFVLMTWFLLMLRRHLRQRAVEFRTTPA
ncbi:metal-dependent hydrolase [Haloferula sp. A504]|uniref:metal-dependent hydrolase n=1 Tax=Haloferula sp. A504 TaxID=3373601 RepID=UPI0031C01B5A|nr:metal-dependent hydrolase [Verrucomicrobiaceae bacterium E54]